MNSKNNKNKKTFERFDFMRSIAITLILLVFSGCENEVKKGSSLISASACSQQLPNGETVDCEVDKSSSDHLTKALYFGIELDKTHPGPSGPNVGDLRSSKSYFVERIDEQNIIHIENGDKIFFAGLMCGNHPDLKRYLIGTFLGDHKYRIHYELTGHEEKGVKFAYVWEISAEYDMLSPTNETLISSMWCSPIEQEAHQFHSRYKLISKFAKENTP